MSAAECLSHEWLRRRNCAPETPCDDLVSQEQINANDDDSTDKRGNELEYQKDTLRNIVDRWNDDTHVISVPAIANDESNNDPITKLSNVDEKSRGRRRKQNEGDEYQRNNEIKCTKLS
jgi:hypothetical protein